MKNIVIALLLGLMLTGCGGAKGIKGLFSDPTIDEIVNDLLIRGNKEACKGLSEADKALVAGKLSLVLGQKIDPTLMCK